MMIDRTGMVSSPSEGERVGLSFRHDEPEARDSRALIVSDCRRVFTFTSLFDETIQELTEAYLALEDEAAKRLRRYKITRIGVALFMCLGVITTLGLNIQNMGLDTLAIRVSPIIMSGALFFYILEALLRDHEVSWECGRESHRLKSLVRRAKINWISRNAPQDERAAVDILMELDDGYMRLDALMSAEKVPPIQEILKKLQGRKPIPRRVQNCTKAGV